MKTNVASRLTVRVKFKSFEQIEICIIDSTTGEVQLEEIPIILGQKFPTTKQLVESNNQEKGDEVPDDADSDEDGRTQRE